MVNNDAHNTHGFGYVSFFLAVISTAWLWSGAAIAQNPVPTAYQPLVPTSAAPGGPGFTLTVNGTGFMSTSKIRWNGIARNTQFVSASKLTASIPAAAIAHAGTATITVSSPTPGGGSSGLIYFPIAYPVTSVSFEGITFGIGSFDSLVTSDFNRDGKADLAGAGKGTLAVFLGSSDGACATGQTGPGVNCNTNAVALEISTETVP
jgi:hypothetical protein